MGGWCFAALDEVEEQILIDVMVCAVKEAATGEPPVARHTVRKVGLYRSSLVLCGVSISACC